MMDRRMTALSLRAPVAAIALLIMTAAGAAADGKGADIFIQKVGQQAIDSLTGKDVDDAERQARFRKILNQTFEVPLIARFTLGRFWRRTSEEQRKEYVNLFEDFIVKAYAARFRDYSGETFTVGKVREIDERDALVQSEITLKDGRRIVVYWRQQRLQDHRRDRRGRQHGDYPARRIRGGHQPEWRQDRRAADHAAGKNKKLATPLAVQRFNGSTACI